MPPPARRLQGRVSFGSGLRKGSPDRADACFDLAYGYHAFADEFRLDAGEVDDRRFAPVDAGAELMFALVPASGPHRSRIAQQRGSPGTRRPMLGSPAETNSPT